MADIKQAALWMTEGKTVFRKDEKSFGYKYRNRSDNFPEMWEKMSGQWTETSIFRLRDLLADDWEIAE